MFVDHFLIPNVHLDVFWSALICTIYNVGCVWGAGVGPSITFIILWFI